jgi:hypothetical protein
MDNTDKILIFIAGTAVGYFVFNEMNKRKKVYEPVKEEPEFSPNTVPCVQSWIDYSTTIRPSSPEEYAKMQKEYITDCIANPNKYLL